MILFAAHCACLLHKISTWARQQFEYVVESILMLVVGSWQSQPWWSTANQQSIGFRFYSCCGSFYTSQSGTARNGFRSSMSQQLRRIEALPCKSLPMSSCHASNIFVSTGCEYVSRMYGHYLWTLLSTSRTPSVSIY